MKYYPVPVIIVVLLLLKILLRRSKLWNKAFDVVNKPGGSISIHEVVQDVIYKIRQAYQSRSGFLRKFLAAEKSVSVIQKPLLSKISTTDRFILMGSSTGGTLALEYILKQLPAGMPPILIVQHMPPKFTFQFAARLNELSALSVKEAEDNEVITTGNVYLAMGGMHLTVQRRGALLYTRYSDAEKCIFKNPQWMYCLLRRQRIGRNALGILLTGMGKDGAEGLLKMKNAGAAPLLRMRPVLLYGECPNGVI